MIPQFTSFRAITDRFVSGWQKAGRPSLFRDGSREDKHVSLARSSIALVLRLPGFGTDCAKHFIFGTEVAGYRRSA
jgi:hypothetical protein